MANVVLPVENKIRELDGKVWLALKLIKEGHDVILGRTINVNKNIDMFNNDVVFIKSAAENQLKSVAKLKQNGCKICVLDTEGAVFTSDNRFLRERVSRDVLDQTDIYFSWGERQKKLIQNRYGYGHKIKVAGNPRFDLVKKPNIGLYENRSKPIYKKYGDYCLFNLNFSQINHSENPGKNNRIKAIERKFKISESEAEKKFAREQDLQKKFIELINLLADNNISLVIRPHPMEDPSYYDNIFDRKNIHVESHGDVRNWIFASNGVVHNGCTTGIEAFMMGKLSIAFCPIGMGMRPSLPNQLSDHYLKKMDKVVDVLNDSNNNPQNVVDKEGKRELLNKNFAFHLNASENICSEVNDLSVGRKERMLSQSRFSTLMKTRNMIAETIVGEQIKYRNYNNTDKKKKIITKKDLEETVHELSEFISIDADVYSVDGWNDLYMVSEVTKNSTV